MSDLEQDISLIKKSIDSTASDSAFEHHAKIMQELNEAGFKPNPVPQVGIEQPSTPPKSCAYFS